MSLVSIPAAAAPLHRRVLDYDEDPLHAQPPSECRSESTVELTSESPDLRYLGCTSRVVPESIAELNYAVTDDQGRQYFPTVVGELIGNRWEAWLEFVPTDDSAPLLTNTETHQSTREDVVRWRRCSMTCTSRERFDGLSSDGFRASRHPLTHLGAPSITDPDRFNGTVRRSFRDVPAGRKRRAPRKTAAARTLGADADHR
jgi:hypothetical protein